MAQPSFDEHLTLLDRYQGYSAELIRLSLAGIGAIGFLVIHSAKGDPFALRQQLGTPGTVALLGALICFAVAAGFGLAHRYFSTDSMAHQLALTSSEASKEKSDTERVERNADLKRSGTAIGRAAKSLGLGAALLAGAFAALAWTPPLSPEEPKSSCCCSCCPTPNPSLQRTTTGRSPGCCR